MAVSVIDFTTGPSTLPDIGELSYNGCVFSPLFVTTLNGTCVKDNAQRTVKYVEYVLTADGYVTLPTSQNSINGVTTVLRRLLTAQGGALVYRGRGIDLVISPAAEVEDVKWGPVPEILEFQPLGAGKSAKIKWQVTVRVAVERETFNSLGLLQFNYETEVTYNEDGYTGLSIRGTMEIPMTREPLQTSRTLNRTVDNFRKILDDRIFIFQNGVGIDLDRFRVIRRNYNVSRDKRTMEFDVAVEEKPYMDLPPECSIARGTYSVRPAKVGMGLAQWLCTLRATYTVRADRPRRVAWLVYLLLLRVRMGEAENGYIPNEGNNVQNPQRDLFRGAMQFAANPNLAVIPFLTGMLRDQRVPSIETGAGKALLMDFTVDEGLYLDSKTVTFSATWKIVTTFSHILLASGLWKKVPEYDDNFENAWGISMRDVSGSRSWLPNEIDPALDVIVDFGGP